MLGGGDAYGGGGTRFFGKLKKAVARPERGHVVAFEGGELSRAAFDAVGREGSSCAAERKPASS